MGNHRHRPRRLHLLILPHLYSPLNVRAQLHLMRGKEEQKVNPRELAAALDGEQWWKKGKKCPPPSRDAPVWLCPSRAIAVPFS